MTATTETVPVLATITGRDLLDQLEKVTSSVQALTVKVDALPASVKDHEIRIRNLEFRQWFAAGVAAAISSGLTGTVVAIVGGH